MLGWLRENKGDDLDAPETTMRHAEIIARDQRWAILTPDRSTWWNGRELSFGPGVPR